MYMREEVTPVNDALNAEVSKLYGWCRGEDATLTFFDSQDTYWDDARLIIICRHSTTGIHTNVQLFGDNYPTYWFDQCRTHTYNQAFLVKIKVEDETSNAATWYFNDMRR